MRNKRRPCKNPYKTNFPFPRVFQKLFYIILCVDSMPTIRKIIPRKSGSSRSHPKSTADLSLYNLIRRTLFFYLVRVFLRTYIHTRAEIWFSGIGPILPINRLDQNKPGRMTIALNIFKPLKYISRLDFYNFLIQSICSIFVLFSPIIKVGPYLVKQTFLKKFTWIVDYNNTFNVSNAIR